jgi:hypothetical protein
MTRRNVPASAIEKLLSLSETAEYLSDKTVQTEQSIAAARHRLSGGFRTESEYDEARQSLQTMVTALPTLQKRAVAAQTIYQNCRAYIDNLNGAKVEAVEAATDDADLDDVRAQIAELRSELSRLRALPTPGADIEQRVRDYVAKMARPTISGIGQGERLRVVWPGAGWTSSGPREDVADVLSMTALVHPDVMAAALLKEVDRVADTASLKDREARIAELEVELADLAYTEEALVTEAIADSEDVSRAIDALPCAVLGVRIVEHGSRAA